MDWLMLADSMGELKDQDYPARTFELRTLATVRDGTLYDHLPYPFSTEATFGGEYVPLEQRRPVARAGTNLARTVVDDAISLLFSEGHWPAFQGSPAGDGTKDTTTKDTLAAWSKEIKLNDLMISAATRGSIGSVALLFRVLEGRPFVDIYDTWFLTPAWKPSAPDTLQSVTERYKVPADDLIAQGYNVDPTQGDHWFMRVWDAQAETWHLPQTKTDAAEGKPPIVDTARTVRHRLGFVPMIWVRNLPGLPGVDGACTFKRSINDCIEVDYLLSQAGRAHRYASDPKLVIRGDNGDTSQIKGGAAQALIVPVDGDAKMLEINGTAAEAVIAHCQELRQLALESMHGNRANADKMSAAQSGRAMELMNQGLIWLADRLRISYGEGALLSLGKMLCAASKVVTLKIDSKSVNNLSDEGLGLNWPAWHPPTYDDMQKLATGLVTAITGGVISEETATKTMAATLDIEDIEAERALIEAERGKADERAAAQAKAAAAAKPQP
jgi:hypothetical protein